MTSRVLCLTLLALFAARTEAGDIFASPTPADIPALIDYLDDANFQLGASKALIAMQGRSVVALVRALDSESSEVRIWASHTLGKIGPDADLAVVRLARILSEAADSQERGAAARALGRIVSAKTNAKSIAVKSLIDGLSDKDVEVRLRSATSLGQIGLAAHVAVAKLVKSFADARVRQAALTSVIAIGKSANQELVKALADHALRIDAAHALRTLDKEAACREGVDRPTVRDLPALKLAIQDDSHDASFRMGAAKQLGEIGLAGAPTLIAAFSSGDEQLARAAATAIGQIGPAAVNLLTTALRDESPTVRAKSADALAAIGPQAKLAVPDLMKTLADKDRTVQHRAVTALDALGKEASDAVPSLIGVMQNPRILEPTRQLALKVLVRVASDKQRPAVIAALKQSSKDTNFGIKSLAAYWLRELETKSDDAEIE
ncbi:MAG: HEAT repeat domain-containing protein [Planctomycetota bacterium]|nr:HEAT repeat domain-containing protein [Planctomycetota bacterium]